MILVTGAGGKTGRALVKQLSTAEHVCAFVYRDVQGPALEALGADKILAGDLRDEFAVRNAMEGVRAVYHICPNMNPREEGIGKLVITAARESGVEHFVYHSVLHPQTEEMTHHWAKLRVEEMIFQSTMPFTILQPAPYMQNLLVGWESIVEEGRLRVPYSVNAKFSFLDLADLAEAAMVVLTESGHKNAIYELAGTAPMSHVEVAQVFEGIFNRAVLAVREEIGDWRLRVVGMSDNAKESLVRMFEYYDRWGLPGNPNVLRWLLQREPTSLESFINRTMKERNVIH